MYYNNNYILFTGILTMMIDKKQMVLKIKIKH